MTDDNRQPLDHLEEVLNGMGFPHERTEETITLRVSFDSDGVNWVIAIAFTVAPSGILFRSPLGLTDLASDSLLEVINRWNVEISVPQVSATDQGEAGVVVVGEGQLTGEASADGINFLQQTLIQCINTLKSQVTLRPLPVEKDGTDPELQRLLDLLASATMKSDEFDTLRQLRAYYEMHGLWEDVAECDYRLGTVEYALGEEARDRNEHAEAVGHFEEARVSLLEAKMYFSDPLHLMPLDVAYCEFYLGVVERFLGEEAQDRNEHPEAVGHFEEARVSLLEAKMYYLDPQHLRPLWVAYCDFYLGLVERSLGEEARGRNEHPEAVGYFEEARVSYLEAKDYYSDPQHLMPLNVAICDRNLGTVERILGEEARGRNEHTEAVGHFEEARVSLLEAKMYFSDPQHLVPLEVAICDFNLGRVERFLGQEAQDRNEHTEVVGHFEKARVSYLEARKYYSDPQHLVPLDVAACDFELGLVERFLGQEARDRNEHAEAVGHFEEARVSYLEARKYYSDSQHLVPLDVADCDRNLGAVEHALGQEARDRNEHAEAVGHFEEARVSYLEARKYYSDSQHLVPLDVADCDRNLGAVEHALGQEARDRNEHAEAVRHLEEAQASFLAAKMYYSDPKHLMPFAVASCDYDLGAVERFLGIEARVRNEHTEAVGHFEKARVSYLEAKDYFSDPQHLMPLEVAACDYGLGVVERILGQVAWDRNEHAEAVGHFEEARASLLEAKDYFSDPQHLTPHWVAYCYFELGLVERFLGEEARVRNEHAEAVGHFEEARVSLLEAKMYYSDPQHLMPFAVASCDYDLGAVERFLGEEAKDRNEHAEAVGHFEEARVSLLEAKMYYSDPQHLMPLDVAKCDFNLGLVEHLLGEEAQGRNEHAEAVGHFEEARASWLAAKMYYSDPQHFMPLDVATCDFNLGNVERALGEEAQGRNEHAEAVGHFEEARASWLAAKMYYSDPQHFMPLDVATCDFNLGNAELLIRNYGSARDYYKAALLYFEANKLWEKVANCDFNLASVAQQLRLPADAASLAISAMTIYDHLYYQLRSYSDRLLWAERHAKMLDIALLAALEVGDDKRVVEIIESARIQALPAPETTSTELAGIVTHSAAHAQIASPADTEPLAVGISLASVAAQGSLAGDPLGPPHGVRLGDGHSLAKSVGIDVSELLGTDNIPEVVNIAEIAKLVGGDNAYWFGSWVSGGALYWYLLGPSGVMDIGNVAMEYLDPLIGQLTQGLPDRLSEEEDDEALGRRVFDSLFFDRERELDLAWSLGEALIPEVLRKLLSTLNESEPISLVIAPAPEIAHIPFPWLSVDEKGTRLIEKAVLRLGASVGLLHEANRLPSNKGAGVLAMLDPTGDLFTSKDLTMQDGTIRTMHLPPDSAASDLADYDALILTNQRHHNDIAASGMYICDKATKQVLESRLASSMPEIFLYLGHIVRGLTPAESGLVFLRNPGNPDASLLARELFSTKAWPMPQRVVFIGCGGARQESREWHGMAPASLCAGARLVLAAQWDLLWMELPGAPGKPWPTYQLALGALEAMKSADPVASWRDRQLKELTQWRSAKHRVPIEHSPIFWSGIMAMGFIG